MSRSEESTRTIEDPEIRRRLITNSDGVVAANEEIGDPTFLSDGYVYGIVTEAGEHAITLEAPLGDSSVTVELRVDPQTTEISSLYGSTLSDIPVGARVESHTVPVDSSAELGPRLAIWVNVNPIYTHGDVVTNEGGVVLVNQAHGGTPRRLHPGSKRTFYSHQHGEMTDLSPLKAGDYVFFTALARGPELDCPDLEPVVVHHGGTVDSAEPNI